MSQFAVLFLFVIWFLKLTQRPETNFALLPFRRGVVREVVGICLGYVWGDLGDIRGDSLVVLGCVLEGFCKGTKLCKSLATNIQQHKDDVMGRQVVGS